MIQDPAGIPSSSRYHRLVGWHAPPLRRVLVAGVLGSLTAVLLLRPLGWELAGLFGWDAGALVFLLSVWFVIGPASAAQTQHLAMREDQTRRTAGLILLGASVASLLAVGFTLSSASHEAGGDRAARVIAAIATVVLSWAVVNTVFTLRYAHLFYRERRGIDFGAAGEDRPDYRDFAYLAFTIGMCYQVSDNTLRNRVIRRTVLVHAMLSYVFGVVIIAASINLVAGLID